MSGFNVLRRAAAAVAGGLRSLAIGPCVLLIGCNALQSQMPTQFQPPAMSADEIRAAFAAPTPTDWEISNSLIGTLPALVAMTPGAISAIRSLLFEREEQSAVIRHMAISTLQYTRAPTAVAVLREVLARPRGTDSLNALYALTNKSDPEVATMWRAILARPDVRTMLAEYAVVGLGMSGDTSDLPLLARLVANGATASLRRMAQNAVNEIRDPSQRVNHIRDIFAQPGVAAEVFVPADTMVRAMARDLCGWRDGPRFDVPIVRLWCQWAAQNGFTPVR